MKTRITLYIIAIFMAAVFFVTQLDERRLQFVDLNDCETKVCNEIIEKLSKIEPAAEWTPEEQDMEHFE